MFDIVSCFLDSDTEKTFARPGLDGAKTAVITASPTDIVNICTNNYNDDIGLSHKKAP